jgi:hypothetical protein
MQYMLMCCIEEMRWESLPEATRDEIMRNYGAWVGDMEKQGKHRLSQRLAPAATARTIREVDSRRHVVDGPFAETKEQLGGYHILDCRDFDEAMSLAARIPTLPYGGVVEVRALESAA